MSRFEDMRLAVNEAEAVLEAADRNSGYMARLICGRLKSVSPYILSRLKRELRDFNMHTGTWRN